MTGIKTSKKYRQEYVSRTVKRGSKNVTYFMTIQSFKKYLAEEKENKNGNIKNI